MFNKIYGDVSCTEFTIIDAAKDGSKKTDEVFLWLKLLNGSGPKSERHVKLPYADFGDLKKPRDIIMNSGNYRFFLIKEGEKEMYEIVPKETTMQQSLDTYHLLR